MKPDPGTPGCLRHSLPGSLLSRAAAIRVPFLVSIFGLAVVSAQRPAERSAVAVYRDAPVLQPFTDVLLARLRVPAGLRVNVYARGLTDPRMMASAADGTVYVTRWKSGDVIALRDTDNDGAMDQQTPVARLDQVHGVALRGSMLYFASPTEIWAVAVAAGQATGSPQRLVAGLPDGGQHPNRVIRFGLDGLLYVSVGSSCNDCSESNQVERGTFIRYTPAGERVDVLAKGLRNSIGFDWHPDTGDLWAMDNGNDFHGNETPPEELNRVVGGRHYGWPICYGAGVVDRMTNARPEEQALRPGDPAPIGRAISRSEFCAMTEPAVATYTAHAAPIWMQFYDGSQLSAFRGDAFVALHGSWNRQDPVGYKVARIRFDRGTPRAFEDFLTGFLDEDDRSYFGRPAGLVVTPDGALLVSDDANGIIYRISSR